VSSHGGTAGAAHQWPPRQQDLHPHNRGATGRWPGKVKAVGAHWFVLTPVRGGDAAARWHSVIDGEAPVVLVGGGVVLEH
jgi:hypothetical protein